MRHNLASKCLAPTFLFTIQLTSVIAGGQDLKIKLSSNDQEIAAIDVAIHDGFAVAKINGETQRFDVREPSWQDENSKRWVKLSQCENWAKNLKEKSANSKAEVPKEMREFVAWSLDPKFEINVKDSTLYFKSGQVDYKIDTVKTDRDLTDFYKYAKLNAYKKAMTQRQTPPFAELKVNEELERRNLIPKMMEIQIPGVPGSPKIKVEFSEIRFRELRKEKD